MSRKELDRRVLVELPESVMQPLDLLRLKRCSEYGVRGGTMTEMILKDGYVGQRLWNTDV